MNKLNFLSKYSDVGLLIIRLVLGLMMIFYGWPKLVGGPEKWEGLGGAMGNLGITFFPVFWGFMAAVTEVLGGALLATGFLTRYACIFLTFVMLVATVMKFSNGDGLAGAGHPLMIGAVFLGLIFVGAGKLSIDQK